MRRRYWTLGWMLVAAGFASIGGGWVGVQSTPEVAVQLAYLASGGLVGLALIITGTALQRHDDIRVIRETVEELRERFDDLEYAVGPGSSNGVAEGIDRRRVTRSDSETGTGTAVQT